MTGPEIVTFGEAMALLLAEPGVPLAHATAFRRQIAGAESNVAIGLARLGHRVRWVGRVGEDPFGETVVRALAGEGIDTAGVVRDSQASTGMLVRDCHRERAIEVVYHRDRSAGSRLRPEDIPAASLTGVRLLHATGITPVLSTSARQATQTAMEAARAAGALVSFDPNIRSRLCPPTEAAATLRPLAALADIVLAGEDEASLLSGRHGKEASAEWFLEQGAAVVVLKAGADGAWATDGSEQWQQPAVPVNVVDPVGAGDAFAAGFLSARLRDMPVREALQIAATVAAAVVQVPGDTDGLPTRAQLEIALAGDREVRR